jgi:competence protein ComEC
LTALAAPVWSAVAVPSPPGVVTALAALGVVWLLGPPGWPGRSLGAVALLPMFVWPGERPSPGALWITALDVGQGSSVVLETRDGAWLYDTGPRYSQDSDAGERVVLPYLRSRGIRALDGIIVSHLDQDHSGGAASVLRGIEFRRLITPVSTPHPVTGGARSERCVAGLQWTEAGLSLRVLHPTLVDYDRRLSTNAMSCVVHAQLGDVGVLLTGDLPAKEEIALVERGPALRSTWMMAPHHGSRSSSSPALLDAVGPAFAVAQSGYRNRFGHPDPQVVARYAGRGVQLVRTDHAGAAQWRFAADGAVEFRAWRAIAVRYWHNRPGAGRVVPTADEFSDSAQEQESHQPLFGMP